MAPKNAKGKTPTSATPVNQEDTAAVDQTKLVQLKLSVTEPKFKNPAPKGRSFHCGCVEDTRIILIGGWDGVVSPSPVKRLPLPPVELCIPLMEWSLVNNANVLTSTSLSSSTRNSVLSNNQNVHPLGEHPAATQAAGTECNGNLYIHGGWTGIQRTNVLTCFDVIGYRWEPVVTSEMRLPALTFHTMASVGRKLYIYGGNMDGTVEAAAPPPPASPAGKDQQAMAAAAAAPSNVVNTLNGDIYTVDLANNNNPVSIAATHGAPPKRSSHTATVFMDTYMIVFGGRGGPDGTTVLGDLAIFDTTSSNWILSVKVENSPSVPGPRYGHAACRVESKGVLIHGGIGPEGDLLSDAWLLTMEKAGVVSWKRVLCEGTLLNARCGHMLAPFPNSHTVMVVGGLSKLPNTLQANGSTSPSEPQAAASSSAAPAPAEVKKESGRVSPGPNPSVKGGGAAAAAASAVSSAAPPADYLLLDFPELRPPGTKTPSTSSLAGGLPRERESASSKIHSIKPHQPLQL